jgi:hypothetical protein
MFGRICRVGTTFPRHFPVLDESILFFESLITRLEWGIVSVNNGIIGTCYLCVDCFVYVVSNS